MRNLCNKGIKNAKNEYVKSELKKYEADPRKFWQVIEKAWSPTPTKNANIKLTDAGTNEPIDPQKVPGTFNDHLCTIASTLAKRFEHNTIPFFDTINNVLSELNSSPISPNEVHDLVQKIEIHKTSAIDKLSSKLLKDSLEVLIPQLTYLFNCSILTSTFPNKWKIANVVLIHKGGNIYPPNPNHG